MRPPTQDRRNYWSPQHKALLVVMAIKVLQTYPQLADGTDEDKDELVNHGWLYGLRLRPPDKLHGCGSTIFKLMLNYLLERRYGCSRYYVPLAKRITHLSMDIAPGDTLDRVDEIEAWQDTIVDDKDELEWIRRTVPELIGRLPNKKWRRVLWMRYVQGLNGPQTAQKLGISDTAVYKHESRSLAALRKLCRADLQTEDHP